MVIAVNWSVMNITQAKLSERKGSTTDMPELILSGENRKQKINSSKEAEH